MTNIVSEVIVTIDRMPAEVWGFVSDPANLHTWMTDVDSPGEWVGGGGPTVGSRYRIDYKYGRKTNEIVFEITGQTLVRGSASIPLKGPIRSPSITPSKRPATASRPG